MVFRHHSLHQKSSAGFHQLNVLSYEDKKKPMGMIVWLWVSDLVKSTVVVGFNSRPRLVDG